MNTREIMWSHLRSHISQAMSSSNSVATTRDEIDVEAELASYRGATVDAISKFKQLYNFCLFYSK